MLLALLLAATTQTQHLPVVIAPGFLGWERLPVFERYLETVALRLEQRGHVVVIARPVAVASSDERAAGVIAAVDKALAQSGASSVVVVAHSQGGLDVRRALPKLAGKVGAVATLVTPHRGTPVAAISQRVPPVVVDTILGPLTWAWQAGQGEDLRWPNAEGALRDCAPNDEEGAAEAVAFFSVSGVTNRMRAGDRSCDGGLWGAPRVVDDPSPFLFFGRSAHLLEGDVSANDGVVPASSAKHGVFLGCVPADHLDWLGWRHALRDDDRRFDVDEFVAVLVEGLEAAAVHGPRAMDAFVPRLAALAGAVPVDAW